MKLNGLFILTAVLLAACFSVANEPSPATVIEPAVTPTPAKTEKIQTKALVPIVELNIGGLLGGSKEGKWLSAKDTAAQLKGGEKYELFDLNDAGKSEITGGAPENEVPCEEFYSIEVKDETNKNSVAFGSALNWNPLPRPVKELSADSPVYKKIIGEVLTSKGLPKSAPKATRILQTDLDGDGTDEVILSATSFKKGVTARGDVGDYSFILLRKVINGKAENYVLTGDFIKNIENAGAPAEYKISGAADLNGDGKMEIVIFAGYYEGNWVDVFELNKKGASSIEQLKTACGV